MFFCFFWNTVCDVDIVIDENVFIVLLNILLINKQVYIYIYILYVCVNICKYI